MKIGILTYRQAPHISANTAIGYVLAKEMQKEHEVCLIGFRQDSKQKDIIEYDGMPVRYLNRWHYHPNERFQAIIRKLIDNKAVYARLSYGLRRIVKQEAIDALLVVSAPSDDIWIAVGSELKLPTVWLQLDPFYSIGDSINNIQKKNFIDLVSSEMIQHLFTTELLYKGYVADQDLRGCLPKISVAQFPKIDIRKYSAGGNKNFKPILLYAGTFYRGIRNPRILIQLKRIVSDSCDVWFCGKCDCLEDEEMVRNTGIKCFGYLSQEKLDEITADADILVNIGNLVHNQLGSKLLDYISTGKPILNITQIENCPTLRVLEKYTLNYTVRVEKIAENKTGIVRFCREMQDARVPKEQIMENYLEYTPDFVAKQILDSFFFKSSKE